MSTEIVERKEGSINFTTEQINLIKRTIFAGATDDELALFMQYCKRKQLDPFSGQIHAVKRKTKEGDKWVEKTSWQVSIDGLRLIADRTSKYQGQTPPMWCDENGQWVEVWVKKSPPTAAKIGVYRDGFKEAVIGVARFDSYAQKKSDGSVFALWAKMPDVMLAKCAEALALRKAFPHEMADAYTPEEMAQAENEYQIAKQNEVQAKDIEIDKNEIAATYFTAIEQCRDLEDLKVKHRKAIAFARTCGDKVLEQNLTTLKDAMKEEITQKLIAKEIPTGELHEAL